MMWESLCRLLVGRRTRAASLQRRESHDWLTGRGRRLYSNRLIWSSLCLLFVCLFWTKGDINATSCRPKLITTTFFRGLVSLIKSGVRVGNCINYQRPSIYYSLRSILNRLQAVDLWTVDIDRTMYMMNVAGSLPTTALSYTVSRQNPNNTTINITTFKSKGLEKCCHEHLHDSRI